jgi:hypothetical protein
MKTVTMLIDEDGNVSVDVTGCHSPRECRRIQQMFERAFNVATDKSDEDEEKSLP